MHAATFNFDLRCMCMHPKFAWLSSICKQHYSGSLYAAYASIPHSHALAALASSSAQQQPTNATHKLDMCCDRDRDCG